MPRPLPLCVLLALLAAPAPAHAQAAESGRYGLEYRMCAEHSTVGILECLRMWTGKWEEKLDGAFHDLLERQSSKEQRGSLQAAQRLWTEFRDANCAFYRTGEGSISALAAAECLRSMTEARAKELEEAAQP